jgi:hypothetical protein
LFFGGGESFNRNICSRVERANQKHSEKGICARGVELSQLKSNTKKEKNLKRENDQSVSQLSGDKSERRADNDDEVDRKASSSSSLESGVSDRTEQTLRRIQSEIKTQTMRWCKKYLGRDELDGFDRYKVRVSVKIAHFRQHYKGRGQSSLIER